ncbi:unnamed protein product [Miscanthus lutarioriparius]|uniref:Translation elongation factor KOW-like domain-containing protein n=1 Tax=Miscanthus lutarioriparius TaxID=422564 RepID=A0A811REG4_9POAL|nr:unnamed protein product [Miscanthus lutarioriparius]
MVVGGRSGRRRVRFVLSKAGSGGYLPRSVHRELARGAERRAILSSPPHRTSTRTSKQLTGACDHGACRLIQRTRPGPSSDTRGLRNVYEHSWERLHPRCRDCRQDERWNEDEGLDRCPRRAQVLAGQVKLGNVIQRRGVIKAQHSHQGRGGATIQVELRDVDTGNKITERFRTDEALEILKLNNHAYNASLIIPGIGQFVTTELATDIVIAVGDVKFYLQKRCLDFQNSKHTQFPLLSKSSRLQTLVASTSEESNDEVDISDIPGGPAAFEI